MGNFIGMVDGLAKEVETEKMKVGLTCRLAVHVNARGLFQQFLLGLF